MKELDSLCINTIRMLAVDAVEKAKSGHPGMPMGAAPMAYVLWTKFLRHNPKNPEWPNRDRFVLSAGHGSLLLYALLHLTGYDLSIDDLKHFRQWGSKTPGHPEYGETPGVETTTGPLGQGFATGVGMALAERFLRHRYNTATIELFKYRIFGIVSDGDLMEGISSEAASLAGSLKLGNLVYLYDSNSISIEGSTDLAFREDVGARFQAYGWHVIIVEDGNDIQEIESALNKGVSETGQPSLIIVKTHIGFGSPNKQDTAEVHGAALGAEEVTLTKKNLDWREDAQFYIPHEVRAHFREVVDHGAKIEAEWYEREKKYRAQEPEKAKELMRMLAHELPDDWDASLPIFTTADGPMATRSASGKTINAIAAKLPTLLGGSADLAPSNSTAIKGEKDITTLDFDHAGRNFHFGVREHAMGAICNGLALSKFIIPYCGTFLIFTDYMKPAMRLAALMKLRVIYVMTHDSIGLGEDGPTHQPVEQLLALRATPNMTIIRPADANETTYAWRAAIQNAHGPTVLALTRQNLPVFDRKICAPAAGLLQGAYLLREDKNYRLILIASGSEVALIINAAEKLAAEGVGCRVVSMPSWELFEQQSEAYRASILPDDATPRLIVEAATPLGWDKYRGQHGAIIGLNRFGASAPGNIMMEKLGFTVENIVAHAKKLLP